MSLDKSSIAQLKSIFFVKLTGILLFLSLSTILFVGFKQYSSSSSSGKRPAQESNICITSAPASACLKACKYIISSIFLKMSFNKVLFFFYILNIEIFFR